jgi:tetratricopeptide (TPR) repeat protein
VPPFTASSELSDIDLGQVTLEFRQRLATLHLQAPAAVPGAAAEGDFMEVLGRGTVDSGNILASLLALLRAAKPSHAWQITGVLVHRDVAPRWGVTIQVLRLPRQANPPQTLWGNSWQEAVRRAADHATASILSRTHLCRAPWAAWRHFVMRGELFEAYEQAAGLEEARRYDEALDAYYDALREDPMNMVIRLHIGQLQEKLALYLDALATYQGMLTTDERDARPHRLGSWHYRFLARAERRHALLIAMYRRAVLLGGDALVKQWRTTAASESEQAWTMRDRRRKELRDRLHRQLGAQVGAVAKRHAADPAKSTLSALDSGSSRVLSISDLRRRGTKAVDELLNEPRPGVSDKDPTECTLKHELRELFALAALQDLGHLAWVSRSSRVALSGPDPFRWTR